MSAKKSARSKPKSKKRPQPIPRLAWLFLAGLFCANLAILLTLWHLVNDPALYMPTGSARAMFLLPLPTEPPPPTAVATQVAVFNPTATVTPTPLPTETPTAVPTPIPLATRMPVATPAAMIPAPPPGKHVVIISIDGLRPDALAQAEAPVLDSLIAQGSYSPNAQTVSLSITLVSHASMLSGLLPAKHGIEWGVPYIGWPGMNGPTIFSLAHAAGLSTAMVFGKDKLNYLVLPGSVDRLFGQDAHDAEIKEQAVKMIDNGLPNLLFIHFPDTDRVGHDYGWMSTNQLQSVAFVDSMIGEVLTAIDRGGYRDSTTIIVTADHGGHGKSHGDDAPQDRTIPWLVVGPGIPAGVTINGDIDTMDTAATALRLLDVPVPDILDGQPIMAVLP